MAKFKPAIRLTITSGVALSLCAAAVKPASVEAQDVAPLRATQQAVLTLESAVLDAVGWHPSVDRAIAALSASGQEIEEAKAGY